MPKVLPQDFTLLTNQIERIPLKQACTVAKKLAEGEMPVRYSQVFGAHRKWVEFRADFGGGSYTLVFGLNEEADHIRALWVIYTPSGKIWCVDHEGAGIPGLPSDQVALLDKLIPQSTERKIVVNQYFRVEVQLPAGGFSGVGPMMDHGRGGPKGLSFPSELGGFRVEFTKEKDAEEAKEKLIAYLEDQRLKDQKAKNSEKNKKLVKKK